MISLFRDGLSVFLMLLQLASPLIHAHKNENFSAAFHLPEFEQISLLLERKSLVFAPVFHGNDVITVGAVIKRRHVLNFEINVFVSSPLFISETLSFLSNRFLFKLEPINFFPFLCTNSPRAPPHSLFRQIHF